MDVSTLYTCELKFSSYYFIYSKLRIWDVRKSHISSLTVTLRAYNPLSNAAAGRRRPG